MEKIIKVAKEGGWKREGGLYAGYWQSPFMESDFWQSISKAYRWEYERVMYVCKNTECVYGNDYELETVLDGFCSKCGVKKSPFQKDDQVWLKNALKFHEINLTKGWDKAISWLEDLLTKERK